MGDPDKEKKLREAEQRFREAIRRALADGYTAEEVEAIMKSAAAEKPENSPDQYRKN
jgi:hypothetical protein